jgi:xylulose-5-phosphate/fructose-6-phosphate phosphoketolase
MQDARLRARQYTRDHGEDIPEVTEWVWDATAGDAAGSDEGSDSADAPDLTGGDNV